MSAATAGGTRRTEQPVWRSSYDVDDVRAQVARPIGDGTTSGALAYIDAWVRSMDRYADHVKAVGRSHELTFNAVKLVERILRRCTDFATGRCEPSLDTIMQVTRFARPTVVRLLALARKMGFIDWVRRTEATGHPPGEGPRVKQTTNAYFFEPSKMPIEALRYLRQQMAKFGRKVSEHPDRRGSGPVPSLGKRVAAGAVKRLTGRWRVDGSRAALANGSPWQLVQAMYPGDETSQRIHLDMLRQAASASSGRAPDSRPHEQGEKD